MAINIKFGVLILVDLNLVVWNSIAIHTCMWYKFWWIFYLKVSPATAKSPNLILCQIFRLYGILHTEALPCCDGGIFMILYMAPPANEFPKL